MIEIGDAEKAAHDGFNAVDNRDKDTGRAGMRPQMTSVSALSHGSRRGKLLSSLPVHVRTDNIVLPLQFALSEVDCGEQNITPEKSLGSRM